MFWELGIATNNMSGIYNQQYDTAHFRIVSTTCMQAYHTSRSQWTWRSLRDMHWMAEHKSVWLEKHKYCNLWGYNGQWWDIMGCLVYVKEYDGFVWGDRFFFPMGNPPFGCSTVYIGNMCFILWDRFSRKSKRSKRMRWAIRTGTLLKDSNGVGGISSTNQYQWDYTPTKKRELTINNLDLPNE